MLGSCKNILTVFQYLIVVLFKYEFELEISLNILAFLENIFENCNLDEKQTCSNFSKLSSFHLGAVNRHKLNRIHYQKSGIKCKRELVQPIFH